eukprot:1235158-Amphidinium_carterae.1
MLLGPSKAETAIRMFKKPFYTTYSTDHDESCSQGENRAGNGQGVLLGKEYPIHREWLHSSGAGH